MKATITSTDQIVVIPAIGGGEPGLTKARVWEGVTEAGVKFTAYISLIQVHRNEDNSVFERELSEHKPPEASTRYAIDNRMV